MTYSLSNNCTKNYYNRTLTVQVIVEDVVTWIFLKHSVYVSHPRYSTVRVVSSVVKSDHQAVVAYSDPKRHFIPKERFQHTYRPATPEQHAIFTVYLYH